MVVSNGNAPAVAVLVVKGYDVSGEVQSDGEPMKEVNFLLYSTTIPDEVSKSLDKMCQQLLLTHLWKALNLNG